MVVPTRPFQGGITPRSIDERSRADKHTSVGLYIPHPGASSLPTEPPPCRFGTTTQPDQRHFIRTPHSAPTRLPGPHIASPPSAMRANHATNPIFCRRRMGTRFRRFVGYQPGTWSHSTSGETKCRATVASRMVWALGIYWIWGRSENDPNDSGKHALPARVGKILDGAHLGRAGCSPARAWTVQGQAIAI